tara:strand:- start:255 stop:1232 length:978 start_codon:yes stop_codon:yes gene_type:complete
MNILITGGAGYIGSNVALQFIEAGSKVTIFDNLSTGSRENIDSRAEFFEGSTLSKNDLNDVFSRTNYDVVIHLAASKAAGESMDNPCKYAENNIIGGLNLINQSIDSGVSKFIFSSTAAVYGLPKYNPIDELHPLDPANYYGFSKLVLEDNLMWFSRLEKLRSVSLRYFNAAGYDSDNLIKRIEKNPQNLIPKIMEVAIGIKSSIDVYGDDFKTKDGTGVRDYIHVSDLADAHLKCVSYLMDNKKSMSINLGTGVGYSVLEVIREAEKISKKKIDYKVVSRRLGDPGSIIASGALAGKVLNWIPKFSSLKNIIGTTWNAYKVAHC